MRMKPNRKDLQEVEHFPSQKNDRNHNYEDGQGFSEVQPVAGRFKPPGDQSKDIKGGKTEHQHPQDAVDVPLLVEVLKQHRRQQLESYERPKP